MAASSKGKIISLKKRRKEIIRYSVIRSWTPSGRMTTLVFFLISLLVLCGIGLIMVTSASVYNAYAETNQTDYYFHQHLIYLLLGLLAMMAVMIIPFRIYPYAVTVGYFLTIGLLIWVLKAGVVVNGSRRWLQIGTLRFQPSEIAKVVTAVVVAYAVTKLKEKIRDARVLWILFAVIAIPTGLVLTMNLSTAIIIAFIGLLILYVGGAKDKQFWWPIAVCSAVLILALTLPLFTDVSKYPSLLQKLFNKLAYRTDRLRAWFHPFDYADGLGYQTVQSMYAIGSGGWMGLGLGNGIQKLGFIPEAHNDIIFAEICEELGVVGGIVVVVLFVILFVSGMLIATHGKTLFERLMSIGIVGQIAFQALINMAVNVNLFPVTGVTLPLVSYGGTSLIVTLASIGILLKVWWRSPMVENGHSGEPEMQSEGSS